MCVCEQYVSTLRPPKKRISGPKGQGSGSDMEDEGDLPRNADTRRRVRSLTHCSPTPTHSDLQRRSLQTTSPRVSVERELKERRRQAGFNQSYGDLRSSFLSESDSDPGQAVETDGGEWKQVQEGLLPRGETNPRQENGRPCPQIERRYGLSPLVFSVSPSDRGPAVERPHAPGRLHPQQGARRRLLLGSRRDREGPGKTQPAAPHTLPRVQAGRLRVLPQPQGQSEGRGWSAGQKRPCTETTPPEHIDIPDDIL